MTMSSYKKRTALNMIADAIYEDGINGRLGDEFGSVDVESNDEQIVVSFHDEDGDVETRLVLSASAVDARFTKVRTR